ncbi:DNA-binding protein [Rhizobacter sp. J219]|uniref:DNA-binding protein n=1 Tax=Rhizobacter sp. J219 TaxID=2898430 RepID=UPI002150ADA8|nr:DNA-binding protein [Rhizobacter sp. J219]MCR5882167.1 DNA-binding protein [Rhizobacter sp. J219]
MARAGIYKSDVLQARNRLVKSGRHPSIDAIRIELGNTGSKGTIHRHLKEIEEEESGTTSQVKASEAIQDLVSRLAERLELEAKERLVVAEARHTERLAELQVVLDQRQQELTAVRAQLGQVETALAQEKVLRRDATDQVTRLNLEVTQLTAQAEGLQQRLTEAHAHGASLEEQRRHAHTALEHFREAAKEQRERELRQHEQQVQYLQAELGKANASLADKAIEIRTAAQEKLETLSQLQAARSEARHLEERLRDLKPLKEQLANQAQIVEQMRAQAGQQAERVDELRTRNQALEQRNSELVSEVAAANAATAAKEQLVASVLARLPIAAQKAKSETAATGSA